MYFTQQAILDRNIGAQWRELWANRHMMSLHEQSLNAQYRNVMTPEQLQNNAINGYATSFWAAIDNEVIALRDQTTGIEIVDDLMRVQTALSVGKTAKLYNVVGDIAQDVSVSIDGQAPYSFDHTEYATDGDPIPVFTCGYGVNWRHAAGLQSVGIDLVLDSQEAKMRAYNRKIVSYMLDGATNIQVENYPAQGLRNHRNTAKIDLGAGGAAIDLQTADMAAILSFFTDGAFGQTRRANKVAQYDIMWVSDQVWGNLSKPYIVNGAVVGTVLSVILPFTNVKEIRQTFALEGNEFLTYVRRKDVVTPLVGAAVGVVALPRPLPNSNYNFQALSALGLNVKKDDEGLSGVMYGKGNQ